VGFFIGKAGIFTIDPPPQFFGIRLEIKPELEYQEK